MGFERKIDRLGQWGCILNNWLIRHTGEQIDRTGRRKGTKKKERRRKE
jgi:hypothetical protein